MRNNLNVHISIKYIECIIKNFPKQKAPGPVAFSGQFYQTFKEGMIPIFYHPFQNKKQKE